MPSKTFNGHLMLNWKDGSMRVMKREPKKGVGGYGPYHIVIKLSLEVQTPETPKWEAKGKVVIPEAQYKEMVIEAI